MLIFNKLSFARVWRTNLPSIPTRKQAYLATECLDNESLLPCGDGLSKSTGDEIEETALKTNVKSYCFVSNFQ